MNFAIVGPGAIGSLWASYLTQAGHKVCLWSRSDASYIAIQRDEYQATQFVNGNLEYLSQADVVLVTLKAPQVQSVLESIASHIDNDAILLLMHNGMGTAQATQERFPHNPLLLATTTHGAYRPSSTQVLHTGLGQTLIGAVNHQGAQCEFLVEVLNHALPQVHWQQQIEQALWNKVAINCAINPLTALHKIRNGELAHARYTAQLNDITAEVALVMQAEGLQADAQQLRQTVTNVIEATANNFSSMQQDIEHQRTSEIDFITGHLIKTARIHAIAVPANEQLYHAIKQIEQSW
ncbi:2-dehydropantoate 2-reductase [Vibrio ichthyoenteri ATCC 700023]|uniref:2-dehydropantoate 2-reductase n=1 Tax=Vibrio ichthyoenteri ATCC 700023 TaxID=870968 RepID=F9S0V9_9VIBR|nr:2-dehydropantoate 2-reductase [Vibrio ichthyoenteri]EGU42942.1 2-dehydropantoate 2-reductase [Vibrio ichthyoenteri ATCC 700023]